MCGIAGIVDFSGNEVKKLQLKAMCDTMSHRGPDNEGIYLSGSKVKAGLGHRRLSIIDLSEAGHQPMSNEDGKIWITLSGEIYNFQALRAALEKKGHRFKSYTDVEVVLHLYEDKGEDAIRDLWGMFAFAIWDENRQKLILGRDRIGKKPLLYSWANNKIVFASEFKALLKHPDINRDIDFQALHHYLTYLCIPAPLTAFRNIKKLPPASIIVCQNGKLELKKYWEPDFFKKIKITEDEAVTQLNALLEDAVKIRLTSDVPLGVLLSGGIDSACVTAFASRLKGKGVRTFSAGFKEDEFNELPYAGLTARDFATNHTQDYVEANDIEVLPKLVEHYGEPFGDSSALPTYYICKLAGQSVKVALNGDGGDEVFGGYRRYWANYLAENFMPLANFINRSPMRMLVNIFPDKPSGPNSTCNIRRFLDAAKLDRPCRYMRWIGFFSEDFKREIYTKDFNNKTNDFDSNILLKDLFLKAEGLDAIDAALYVDTMFGLQNDLVVKMDIASMANSLETRSPLLDHRLVEFSASLASKFKVRNNSLKYIFKKSLNGLVSDRILKRPKKGFAVPVDEWFRGCLKDYLVDIILSDRAFDRGYFNPDKLNRIAHLHMEGKENYGQHLWGLLMLELWHRRFIDA
ncbi:MAG: asparagine synthase (glutamine-hydrolyzing) [Candidatus Omnitrophota bacterium]|nr:asparagine synthase (glutamine-hydrolyzing) [Candidatus Omnitrophota bacterium]